ncbi:DUF456 family protein [Halocalculus aciditolerans]|uniref:DUF456 domain-containing protein n=1 Tax=Halocalculus aciditolerans TaxID=1383812 RepID=A0A830FI33_9EURY|nr:DUF456 family protein [Halocalculus aciditolerans]GGL54903.1 hypothetical protein GCM10009039_11260 [Halocalculus aciditolerans]
MGMLDANTALALLLVLGAVVVSIVPRVPASPFVLGGLALYWYSTDFMMVSPLELFGLLVGAVGVVAVEHYATRRIPVESDVTPRTALVALGIALVAYLVGGVPGLVLGVVATVAVENYLDDTPDDIGLRELPQEANPRTAVSNGVDQAIEDTTRTLVASGLQLAATAVFSAVFVATTKIA